MSFFHHLPWVTIFGLLGNTISFMVFMSPIPTFYGIYKKKSTEGFQSVPYVVALFSSMLWILYALFAPDSTFLKTINAFGCFIETLYISIFLLYATKQSRMLTLKLLFLMNVAGFGSILFITLVVAKTTRARIKFLGLICLVFSLSVFAAPLGVVRQVIRTKSVKYMPFLLSFFLTMSAVMWFFYGLLKKDYYVAIPNVLGFSFGLVQMALYAMYRKSTKWMEDVMEAQKIPSKLGPQEMPISSTGSELRNSASIIANNNQARGGEDSSYAIEIRNVNRDMIDRIKKIGLVEVENAPKLVTLAT